MLERPLTPGAPTASLAYGSIDVPVMLALAPIVLLGMFVLVKKPLVPASIAVLVCGVAVGLALNPDALAGLRFGPERVAPRAPELNAFSTAAARCC